jgi:hypothetical protein
MTLGDAGTPVADGKRKVSLIALPTTTARAALTTTVSIDV